MRYSSLIPCIHRSTDGLSLLTWSSENPAAGQIDNEYGVWLAVARCRRRDPTAAGACLTQTMLPDDVHPAAARRQTVMGSHLTDDHECTLIYQFISVADTHGKRLLEVHASSCHVLLAPLYLLLTWLVLNMFPESRTQKTMYRLPSDIYTTLWRPYNSSFTPHILL